MKHKKINIQFILLLTSLFLIETSNFAQNVNLINPIKDILFKIGLLIAIINSILVIIKLKISLKKLLFILCLFMISFLIKSKTGDNIMIETMLLFISSLNISFDKIIKKDLLFKVVLFIFIATNHLCSSTIISNFIENGKILYSFGFKNPNTTGFYIFLLFVEYLYSKRNKVSIRITILSFITSFILINMTKSRTAIIALVFFIIIYALISINKKSLNNKKIKYVYHLFLILTILSYYITILYMNGTDLALKLDRILSARIWIQSFYLKYYHITLLGNSINYIYTIDNAYMRILLNFGIVGIIFFSLIYRTMFKISIKHKDKIMYGILLTLLLYGLSEWCIIRPGLNVILLYCSCNLLNNKIKEVI